MPVKNEREQAQEHTPRAIPGVPCMLPQQPRRAPPPLPEQSLLCQRSRPGKLDLPRSPGRGPDKGVGVQNKSLDFPYQLQQLMGAGTVPVRLDISGHSLGAGVASICAVWASLTWPTADVRLVTFGSPKVGPHTSGRACFDDSVT